MTLNPDWGTRWCIGVGLIGVGSSRDSEARGVFVVGNSVVLTDGLVAMTSGVGLAGSLGAGGLSLSITREGGLLSTGGSNSGGAVVERPGKVRGVITGETFSLSVLRVGSEMTVEGGLGRANP